MATTSFATGDSQTRKAYAADLLSESVRGSLAGLLVPKSNKQNDRETAGVYMFDELVGAKGDVVNYTLRKQLTGAGKQGSEILKGAEESLTTYTSSLTINLLRWAVSSEDGISWQRLMVKNDIRDVAKEALKEWWIDRLDQCIINQLAGNTAQTDTKYTGNNSVSIVEITNHRVIRGQSNVQSLTTGNEMTPQHIDYCVAKARQLATTTGEPIKPLNILGKQCYVLIVHSDQARDLRAATGAGSLLDMAKSFFQGAGKENPIADGGYDMGNTKVVGYYNNTLILENPFVPLGLNDSTGAAVTSTRAAVFLGRGALAFGFGKNDAINRMNWVEESDDYENIVGVSAGLLFGCKRIVFNGLDHGVILVPTYAAA